MHQRPLALTLLALAGVAGLVAANQALIANQSEVMYVATQMGSEVEGNFGRFEAQINLDPDKPQTSSVWFAVDTSSVICASNRPKFPSTSEPICVATYITSL